MTNMTRRGLLAGSAVVGVAGAFATGTAMADSRGVDSRGATTESFGPVSVPPDDPRYQDLLLRRNNARFDQAKPASVQLVGSTDQVVRAVQTAVREGKRVVVRSGGHCFEDFVDNPDTEVIIDLSELNAVRYDVERRAFEIGPGALLEDVYRTLYYGWGVTIPAGGCLGVGAGGHFSGGGYGPMSRMFGSVVDFLYAVEVVVVDRHGRAKAVVATREPGDEHHELWWAHTGGGGGNFGVVTRYWLRSPDADGSDEGGSDPSAQLPKPPATLLSNAVIWTWQDMTRASFVRLLRNYGRFLERHNAPDSPYASLYCPLLLPHSSTEDGFLLSNQIDGTLPNAERLLQDFIAEVNEGVDAEPQVIPPQPAPWLTATLQRAVPVSMEKSRHKIKAGYLRKSFTEKQLGVVFDYLHDGEQRKATVLLVPYGGKVNTVAPDATATPQRDSILKMVYQVDWTDPAQDADQISWSRNFYRELYADTGGVPVPNDINDGSYINYPDVDLADPELNTSGVPWHALYYKDNYPRLQRIKATYDPGDVFHHALSIRLP